MAFVPIFCDSFDHYNSITQKWAVGNTPIDLSGTLSRTGIGCLTSFGGEVGAQKSFSPITNVIVGFARVPSNFGVAQMLFLRWHSALDELTSFKKNEDGSISCFGGNEPFQVFIGQTPPNVLTQGIYNYLEFAADVSGTVYPDAIHVIIRVNGIVQLDVVVTNESPGSYFFDAAQVLLFDSGDAIDDLYIGTSTTPATIGNDFQGAVRIYPWIPSADESPLDWTPLAGSNFSEVNQIPTPGDTAYVTDGTVGDIDQYHLAPVPGHGPSGAFTVQFAQTVMDAKIDAAGTRLIAPDIGGNVGTSVSPSTNYAMTTQPYSTNPVTGIAWTAADFAATFLGPKVTG